MADTLQYAHFLGIATDDPLKVAERVEKGLAYSAFERLRQLTALSAGELAAVVNIPVRTLHRRQAAGRLQPDESDRLLRASRIFARALELFEGDVGAAQRWLAAPQRSLGGARPIAFARTDVGAREVESLIGRLEHGIPS